MSRQAIGLVLGVPTALILAGPAGTHEPSFRPVASVTQIMQAMVIPASNALFDVPRDPPADEQAWMRIERHAVVLAESGNLLLIGARAKDSRVWTETSLGLARAGEAVLQATQTRNIDAITEAGNRIIEACEGCHQKYWIR